MPKAPILSRIEWPTLFSLLCTMVGTGILQLPLTLKQGGWACIVLIVLCGLLTNTTGRWLIRSLHAGGSKGEGGVQAAAERLADYPAVG